MLLREVLKTKYLTDEYAADIDFIVSSIANNINKGTLFTDDIYAFKVKNAINIAIENKGVVFDLSDCRFTGSVWDSIARSIKSYPFIRFIDSTDKSRDDFLRDYSMFKYEFKDWETLRGFPNKPRSIDEFPTWVSSLRQDVVYELYDGEYTKNPCFILAVCFFEPNIHMILDNKSVLEYAKRVFGQYMISECTEFYYLYSNQYELLEADAVNGMVRVVNIGDFDRITFIQKFLCMPRFIGNRRVSLAKASSILKRSVRDVLSDTASFLSESPTTIETYFPFKESYT